MGVLEFAFKLSTWALILAFTVFAVLGILSALKYIIPNKGDGDLVEISESAFAMAKWGAFFAFLAFLVLMAITAGAEYIVGGKVTNPTIVGFIGVVQWVGSRMEFLVKKFFGGYAYDPAASASILS